MKESLRLAIELLKATKGKKSTPQTLEDTFKVIQSLNSRESVTVSVKEIMDVQKRSNQ